MKINPVVFLVSAAIILSFVALGAAMPEQVGDAFGRVQEFIVSTFGWFYIVSVGFFLLFVLWLLVSPYGRIRLGKDDDEPEYSTASWFAMLFSAGMGIGLLFFSVAEPMMHFARPLISEPGTLPAAREAMKTTFFHWGLHAWAIYIVVGLSLAYFAYRHNLPLTIRSTLYPLLGDRIHGRLGDLVDILAVFGTLFGVATSLGLGVQQINAGMAHLGLFEVSQTNQIILITVITLMATVSVVSGVDVGIRRLSELNLGIGMVLLLFVFFAGPTVLILGGFVQGLGDYVQNLVQMTFRTTAMRSQDVVDWQKGWTLFYWGWWISWSPFVGMFIARISRGRTIRQFVLGVLFVPTLLAFAWMVVMGDTAISMELTSPQRPGQIAQAVADPGTMPTGLFLLLEELPLSSISIVLATVVIATYFITSSDSASLVIDILTAGGHPDPPIPQRVFWALLEGAVAAVLLVTGGLVALQTAAITTALPFCAVMLLICWSLVRGLRGEKRRLRARAPAGGLDQRAAGQPAQLATEGAAHPPEVDEPLAETAPPKLDWRQRLDALIQRQKRPPEPKAVNVERAREQLSGFISAKVVPAFEQIADELSKRDRRCEIESNDYHATITVLHGEDEEFSYAMRARAYLRMSFALPDVSRPGRRRREVYRGEVVLDKGAGKEQPIDRWTVQAIIDNFLAEYAKWMDW